VTVKKVAGWAVVIFLAWFIITDTAAAQTAAINAKNGITHAFSAGAAVLTSVFGG